MTKMNLAKNFALKFAPYIYIHSNESYYPMDPLEFIKLSRFRHYINNRKDQGYNKVKKIWIKSNSNDPEYYDIPVNYINTYTIHKNGKNRRPKDDNSGEDWDVFIQPKDNPIGNKNPNKIIPIFYHYRFIKNTCIVTYWWFFGYNFTGTKINHQGDWEHITVFIKNDKLIKLIYYTHGNPKECEISEINLKNGRPIIYCAKGTHASYHKTGNFPVKYKKIKVFTDIADNNGYEWDTSKNIKYLENQPWKDYAGAWGEVGASATTTGPLGPLFKSKAILDKCIVVGELIKINASNFNLTGVDDAGWEKARLMTALNKYIYIIRGDELIKMNAETCRFTSVSDTGWRTAKCITALDKYIYIIRGDELIKMNAETCRFTGISDTGWRTVPVKQRKDSSFYIKIAVLFLLNRDKGQVQRMEKLFFYKINFFINK